MPAAFVIDQLVASPGWVFYDQTREPFAVVGGGPEDKDHDIADDMGGGFAIGGFEKIEFFGRIRAGDPEVALGVELGVG